MVFFDGKSEKSKKYFFVPSILNMESLNNVEILKKIYKKNIPIKRMNGVLVDMQVNKFSYFVRISIFEKFSIPPFILLPINQTTN